MWVNSGLDNIAAAYDSIILSVHYMGSVAARNMYLLLLPLCLT